MFFNRAKRTGSGGSGGGVGGSEPDASTTTKGVTKLSTAPASAGNPIAVGDNDPRNTNQRVPTDASVTAAKISDAELLALAGLVSAADKLAYFTGSGTASLADLSAFGRSLIDDADAPTALSTLGVSTFIKTLLDDANAAAALTTLGAQPLDVDLTAIATLTTTATGRSLLAAADAAAIRTIASAQASDTELDALASLVSAANKLPYFTGSGTASLADLTAAGRALLDDADASAQLTTLGVSTFIKTLLDDADAAAAQATLGVSTIRPGVRAYNSAQPLSIPTGGAAKVIPLDSEEFDSTGMHSTTSGATGLTGTFQKTSGSAAVVGTGTAFTTELKVGDRITIPGTANETKYVDVITDATHLTVDSNFANSASGQAATVNRTGRITATQTGPHLCVGQVSFAAAAAGQRQARLHKNGSFVALSTQGDLGGVVNVAMQVVETIYLVAGDYVELAVFQSSGAAINTVAANPLSLSASLQSTV